jgi:hypothetical protein
MGRWAVTEGTDEVFVVVSQPDGKVSLDIPSSPLVVTREQAERIRMYIGAALGDTTPGRSS